MREKSKCGRIFASTRSSTSCVLPAWMSLSARNTANYFIGHFLREHVRRDILRKRWRDAASNGTARQLMRISVSSICSLPPFRVTSRLLLVGVVAFGRLVEQELADQVLEHHRRLRQLMGSPFASIGRRRRLRGRRTARRGCPRSGSCGGVAAGTGSCWSMFIVTHGLVAFVVEADVGDAADHHAGALHRRRAP